MVEIALTDDEVFALGVTANAVWPGGLPTVGVSDEEAGAAQMRGLRSLAARGLVPLTDELSTLVTSACHDDATIVSVYLGDADFQRASWALTATNYRTADGWIAEATDITGLHRFTRITDDEFSQFVTALLQKNFESGPQHDDSSPIEWLCAHVASIDTSVMFAVQLGRIVVGDTAIAGGEVRPTSELEDINPTEVGPRLAACIAR